ncbi:response regulator [Deefgea tanakiae]|uniref:histidine kinase n=1 Tax=Deefgea tanakiae TaxID=2865840 RepID=A0ABX8Z3G6_9NEIS|nr:response regulator [Deefgea tanakiae]QZA76915.1 response regulator [Deefgea tanakiae]
MPLDVLPALLRAQSNFNAESLDSGVFSAALQDLLQLSESPWGGIGELNGVNGVVQLTAVQASKTKTDTSPLWSLQAEHRTALAKGRAVCLNQSPMNAAICDLLGLNEDVQYAVLLPMQYQDEVVGIALLANKNKAYKVILAKKIAPLLTTLAQLILFQRQVLNRLSAQEKHDRQQASLRALSQITALRQRDDHTLIADALYLGCSYFGVPFGIVSHIQQDDYVIEVQYSANGALQDGAQFRLGKTYCSLTYQADDVVAISMMGLSPWGNHPCYAEFGLETYIGIPIWVAGQRYGTLNFSSPEVQERQFDEIDHEFLRLMSRWVGGTIERQLARQERDDIAERFRKIGEQVPGLIFQTRMNQDGSSAYLYASAGIEGIYGLKPLDVADDASKVLMYLHPDDVNEVVASYTKALATLSHWDTVYRIQHPSKGLIWVEAHAKPERTPEGDTLWYGMVMDVTEQQAAKFKLQQAMQAAEAANQAKSLFLANMSHEIRTPMNGVLGMISLLLDSNLTPQQREYAETVRFSGDVLMGVINDILDFSKIEAGRLELETLDFDLPRLLNDFSAMMSLRLQEKGLRYQCDIAAEVPTMLRGDPGRLRQVLINLVGNAIKFTDHGHVSVSVSLESQTTAAITLRFCVSDTGIGIPSDKIHRLFNSFSQVDESTSRRFGGTGLGLAICKQIVTLMGGEIAAHSIAEQGTDFVFTVQMAMASSAAHIRLRQASTPQQQKVLLVDAIDSHREALVSLLSAWAWQVVAVSSSAKALALLREGASTSTPFTLAVCDLHLPEMDGLQLARAIKGETALAALPLVLVTAIGVRGDGSRAHQAGFAAYLTKPVVADEFYGVLELVLQGEGDSQLVTRHTLKEVNSVQHCKVLLAEDNPVNRMVAVKMLEKLGCSVVTVENGRFALMAVLEQPFDLVFMDMQMPEMDGLEATRLIRSQANGALSGIPIIALTANALADDKQRCFDVGMDDFLVKPIQSDALLKALKQWARRP